MVTSGMSFENCSLPGKSGIHELWLPVLSRLLISHQTRLTIPTRYPFILLLFFDPNMASPKTTRGILRLSANLAGFQRCGPGPCRVYVERPEDVGGVSFLRKRLTIRIKLLAHSHLLTFAFSASLLSSFSFVSGFSLYFFVCGYCTSCLR